MTDGFGSSHKLSRIGIRSVFEHERPQWICSIDTTSAELMYQAQ